MIKIGDRVRLLTDHPDRNIDLVAGCTGIVVGIIANSSWVSVDWDDEVTDGHDCDGLARRWHGWNVMLEDISSIEEEEEFECEHNDILAWLLS